MDLTKLSDSEHTDWVFAKLMNSIIEKLEMTVQSDRIYGRLKHEVLIAFHEARDEMDIEE
jgi:hypothetical protein